ncbi:MAG: VanZ family protein [Planctomycetes bacterium]|nr:VanZ family protein [Planctomycetota bacterium]
MSFVRRWLIDGRPRFGIALLVLAAASIGMLLIEGARPPAAAGLKPFPHFDKVLHLGAHGWSSGLLFWGGVLLGRPRPIRRRVRLWAALVLTLDALAGVAVEFVQLWFGSNYGRQFDWKDVVANILGTLIAVVASAMLALWLSARGESPAEL